MQKTQNNKENEVKANIKALNRDLINNSIDKAIFKLRDACNFSIDLDKSIFYEYNELYYHRAILLIQSVIKYCKAKKITLSDDNLENLYIIVGFNLYSSGLLAYSEHDFKELLPKVVSIIGDKYKETD